MRRPSTAGAGDGTTQKGARRSWAEPLWRPAQSGNRGAVQPDQRIAMTQGVIKEGEFMVACERREPQRQPRHLDCERVAVHAAQTMHGHQATRVLQRVLVGGQFGVAPVRAQAATRCAAKAASRLDKESAAAHGGIDNTKREDRLGRQLRAETSQFGRSVSEQ